MQDLLRAARNNAPTTVESAVSRLGTVLGWTRQINSNFLELAKMEALESRFHNACQSLECASSTDSIIRIKAVIAALSASNIVFWTVITIIARDINSVFLLLAMLALLCFCVFSVNSEGTLLKKWAWVINGGFNILLLVYEILHAFSNILALALMIVVFVLVFWRGYNFLPALLKQKKARVLASDEAALALDDYARESNISFDTALVNIDANFANRKTEIEHEQVYLSNNVSKEIVGWYPESAVSEDVILFVIDNLRNYRANSITQALNNLDRATYENQMLAAQKEIVQNQEKMLQGIGSIDSRLENIEKDLKRANALQIATIGTIIATGNAIQNNITIEAATNRAAAHADAMATQAAINNLRK